MPERRKLSDKKVTSALKKLKGWSLRGGKLHKEFTFGDFVDAFGFMTSAALIAQRLNHHPEWSNVYNKVVIDLSTHSEGGITGYDIEFAKLVDQIGGKRR
jgi:4a-hydroxytetrahydrobiopterin dehydratase